MNQVKTKLEEELKKDDEIIKTLQDGANVWGKPDAENNFIILGNTHGNASMSLVMFDERESISLWYSMASRHCQSIYST